MHLYGIGFIFYSWLYQQLVCNELILGMFTYANIWLLLYDLGVTHVHVYIYICIFVYVYELVMYDTQLVVPTVDTLPLRYTYYVVLMAIYV